MANHFEIKTTQKLTADFINKHLNEYVDKWMFGLFEVEYHLDGDRPFWNVSLKNNDDYNYSFFFWINENDDLEFRHSPKADITRWLEDNWFEYIAKKVKNPQLYDEGIDYFGFENNVDKYNGYREYKNERIENEISGVSSLQKKFMRTVFKKKAFGNIPKELEVFFDDYKEKVQENYRNNNIDKVINE